MRKLIVQMSISVDGYVAPSRGAADHRSAPEDPTLKQRKLDWLREAGTHAMGRVTYEEMSKHWPYSSDPYAAPMNELPKVVFTKTLQSADWSNSRVASGDLAKEVSVLRSEPGGDIIALGRCRVRAGAVAGAPRRRVSPCRQPCSAWRWSAAVQGPPHANRIAADRGHDIPEWRGPSHLPTGDRTVEPLRLDHNPTKRLPALGVFVRRGSLR